MSGPCYPQGAIKGTDVGSSQPSKSIFTTVIFLKSKFPLDKMKIYDRSLLICWRILSTISVSRGIERWLEPRRHPYP